MRLRRALTLSVLLWSGSALAPPSAQAIASFSRLYGLKCGACHSAIPQLNMAGEEFRLSGYRRFEGGTPVAKVPPVEVGGMSLPGIMPVSLLLTVGFDYHAVTEHIRATNREHTVEPNGINLENVELLAGAPIGRHLSFYLDFPLARTAFRDNDFVLDGPQAPDLAAIGFHNLLVDDLINVRVGASELPLAFSPAHRRFSIAPYEIYEATAQKLLGLQGGTRTGIANSDQIFTLSKSQLSAEIFGTAYPELLGVPELLLRYQVGTGNDTNRNTDNNSAKSIFGRLSLGYLSHTLGVFGFWSPNTLDGSRPAGFPGGSNEVRVVGPDLTLRFFDETVEIQAQYLWFRNSDPTGTGRSFEHSGGFIGALVFIRAGELGMFAPLARFDYVEGNRFDNTAQALALGLAPVRTAPRVWAATAGLQYLPLENLKIFVEVTYRETEDRLSKTESTATKDRSTEMIVGLRARLTF